MSTPKKETNMPILEAFAVLDAALTITERILAHMNGQRLRGELTPEEEAALDARQEAMFKSPAWQLSKPLNT